MINPDQLIEIGKVQKIHGLNGELTVSISDTVFDDVKNCPYLICEIDGIYVPFFIANYKFRADSTILLTFDGVKTQEDAQEFCGHSLYFDRRCFTKKEAKEYEKEYGEDEDSLVGYEVIDKSLGKLGKIVDIDDQTANVLFIVNHNEEELLIPAVDELIENVDDENRTILMNLPIGLVNLEEAEEE